MESCFEQLPNEKLCPSRCLFVAGCGFPIVASRKKPTSQYVKSLKSILLMLTTVCVCCPSLSLYLSACCVFLGGRKFAGGANRRPLRDCTFRLPGRIKSGQGNTATTGNGSEIKLKTNGQTVNRFTLHIVPSAVLPPPFRKMDFLPLQPPSPLGKIMLFFAALTPVLRPLLLNCWRRYNWAENKCASKDGTPRRQCLFLVSCRSIFNVLLPFSYNFL